MICKNCGNNIQEGMLFCSKCGMAVKIEKAKPIEKTDKSNKKKIIIGSVAVTVVAVAVIIISVFASGYLSTKEMRDALTTNNAYLINEIYATACNDPKLIEKYDELIVSKLDEIIEDINSCDFSESAKVNADTDYEEYLCSTWGDFIINPENFSDDILSKHMVRWENLFELVESKEAYYIDIYNGTNGITDDENDFAEQPDDNVNNNVDEKVDVNDSNNNDDVIELTYSDCYFIDRVCHQYGQKSSEDFFGLAFKKANDEIKKIDSQKTIAIYTAYDSVRFVPVISEPKYTVAWDFEDGIDYDTKHVKVTDFPDKQFSALTNESMNQLTDPGHPIIECNGTPLEDFILENSKEYFVYNTGYYYSHLYIEAEKKDTFTFGGYIGTDWVEVNIIADIEYYEIDGAITITSEQTKNGYFTLDCSELIPGLYYVIEFDTFVELV